MCFFVFINLLIYLFLAALGLHCCAWAFCSCSERGLLFLAVRGLLIAVASLFFFLNFILFHFIQQVLISYPFDTY